MSISRRLARPWLATSFVADGLDALLRPSSYADMIEESRPLLERAGMPPAVTNNPQSVARAAGGATALAGLMLATGRRPRTAASVLFALELPRTVIANPVWQARDRQHRQEMQRDLMVRASLLGGLLLAALDRDGKPSMSWRAANRREHQAELREIKGKDKGKRKG